ncbi:MAG: molybdenum cofactor carrier protein [Nitrospinae bacterium]|nr:molybdenum cofactor carrier protein [Nitrospinota bacterium]
MMNKIVAVIGSGTEAHTRLSQPLGKYLAENGFHLINGGGAGVMEKTARAFYETQNRKGKVIGVLPSSHACETEMDRSQYKSPPNYPNGFTEIIIRTHLPDSGTKGKLTSSRNHIIILSADLIVALPGGSGTRSEIELALDYKKPVILLSPDEEWKSFKGKAEIAAGLDDVIRFIESEGKC